MDYTYPPPGGTGSPHAVDMIGSSKIVHDTSGNVTDTPWFRARYDDWSKLKEVSTPTTGKLSLDYAADGSLAAVKKFLDSEYLIGEDVYCKRSCELRFNDAWGNTLASLDRNKSMTTLGDEASTANIYVGGPNSGTTREVGPFAEILLGKALSQSGTKFNSGMGLRGSGLWWFGNRVYSEQMHTFLQSDSFLPDDVSLGTYNRYTFARDNGARFTEIGGNDGFDTTLTMSWSDALGLNGGFMNSSLFSFGSFTSAQDRAMFLTQLANTNTRNYNLFVSNPTAFVNSGLQPMSYGAFSKLSSGPSGGENISSFAQLPHGSISGNIAYVKSALQPTAAFLGKVAPWLGDWDYKASMSYKANGPVDYWIAVNAGNFNYGAVGSALGYSPTELLQMAGVVQFGTEGVRLVLHHDLGYFRDWNAGVYGELFNLAPYGDDPVDQYWIQRGIDYYELNAEQIRQQIGR